MKNSILFLLMLLGSLVAEGSNINWVRLKTTYTYRDLYNICSIGHYPKELLLSMEVVQGKATRVALKEGTTTFPSQIVFSSNEVQGVGLYEDKEGKLWVQKIELSSRILAWIATHMGTESTGCSPSQEIVSLSPKALNFVFDLSTIMNFPSNAQSNLGKFEGQIKELSGYEAEVSFTQEQI